MRTPADLRPGRAACVALFLAVALVSGCDSGVKRARVARVPVTVAPAVQRSMPYAIPANGTVEPIQTAAVGSQVGGVVMHIPFREGDEVREGQVLIELDPRPFHATLDQALGTLHRDLALADNAIHDRDRSKVLFEQGAIAQADWDQKQATAESAIATAHMDSAAVAQARLNLQYATIRAPIAGQSGRLNVHVGDLVKAATSDPLVTINQIHPVRVRFTVPENTVTDVMRYRDKSPRVIVQGEAPDTVDVVGRLVFVDNAVDPSSGTLMLKGEFQNRDGRLVPGQFVDVRLVLFEDPHATVVPAQSVTIGQQGPYVYVLNADSTVTPRPIAVSRTVDEYTIVSGGLRPGEVVVTDGQLRLAPGVKVVVRHATSNQS
jgi:multidrug efflux system membrane fusion protein